GTGAGLTSRKIRCPPTLGATLIIIAIPHRVADSRSTRSAPTIGKAAVVRTRMSRPLCDREQETAGDAGFTLFEILVVMTIIVMAAVAISAAYHGPSAVTTLKSAAHLAASRLRDLRATAMATGSERIAAIDVESRAFDFGDGRAPMRLDRSVALAVT